MSTADLLSLVESAEFDAVYHRVGVDGVAHAWLEYHRSSEDDRDGLWWAIQLLFDDPDEQRRRSVILRLLEHARDDDEIGTVAAGPLESYLSDDPSTLHWIEREAGTNPVFRRALARVNAWRLQDLSFERVERAAGVKLARPDREAYERRHTRSY